MYQVEDTHFWYRGMRQITAAILGSLSLPALARVLDAGCGTGANLAFLCRYGKVEGLDISPEAVRFCRQRGHQNVRLGSINKLPFTNNSFDLVTNFDVLGSLGVNEKQALAEFYRVLKPGGYLLIRVSAYQSLMSKHDKLVHTTRRYQAKDLTNSLTKRSFQIVRTTYANTFFFPLLALRRLWQKRLANQPLSQLKSSDVTLLPPWVNRLALFPLLLEAWLLHFFDFPFGLSLIILARKREDRE